MLPWGSKFFPLRVDRFSSERCNYFLLDLESFSERAHFFSLYRRPFSERSKNVERAVSLENVYIPFKGPFSSCLAHHAVKVFEKKENIVTNNYV